MVAHIVILHCFCHSYIREFCIMCNWLLICVMPIRLTPVRSIGPLWSSASELCFQLLPWPLFKSFPLFHLPPLLFCSHFLVFLPLLHCLCGFQLKALFAVAEESFLSLLPVHFHFCSLVHTGTSLSYAHLHIASFERTLGQNMLNIFLRHLFLNVRSIMILLLDVIMFYVCDIRSIIVMLTGNKSF